MHLCTTEQEALAELRNHVQKRYNAGDPTLASAEEDVLPLLIGEMEELETALHQGHTNNVVAEMGDVLYMKVLRRKVALEIHRCKIVL